MSMPPCAGIIVFDNDKVALVNTNCGNFSFPKGKRNKSESDLEVAWRELEEETGLTKEHVNLIDEEYYIDELNNKGNLCVRYFIGTLSKNIREFKFDPKELANAQWYYVRNALTFEKFKKSRREILDIAYKKLIVS